MPGGGSQGEAFDDLMQAVEGLAFIINAAQADNPARVQRMLNMVFSHTAYLVLPREAEGAERPAAALVRAVAIKDDARAGNEPDRKTEKLAQALFQYVVLFRLSYQNGPMQKVDLLACLPPELDFGSAEAITTRLNNMRSVEEGELIRWEKYKQRTPIEVTQAGRDRLTELASTSPAALTHAQKQFLASKNAWFGNAL